MSIMQMLCVYYASIVQVLCKYYELDAEGFVLCQDYLVLMVFAVRQIWS